MKNRSGDATKITGFHTTLAESSEGKDLFMMQRRGDFTVRVVALGSVTLILRTPVPQQANPWLGFYVGIGLK